MIDVVSKARRPIVINGRSRTVTIPKEWTDDLEWNLGDPIALELRSDGTILLSPIRATITIPGRQERETMQAIPDRKARRRGAG